MTTVPFIGQMVRTTLADYPFPLKIVWFGIDTIVCEYRDDAGNIHEASFSKDQLEEIA